MDKIFKLDLNNLQTIADNRPRVEVLGVRVDNLKLADATARIVEWVQEHRANPAASPRRVVTVNPEYIMAARRNKSFKNLINTADLVSADGVGLILAGRALGQPFKERVTGVALCENLFKESGKKGLRLFLLGAQPGVAEEAAGKLREQYPDIRITGSWAGEPGPGGDGEATRRIREAGADILLVAYGMLKQDWWIARNLKNCGVAVAIGVGGVLDYKAGRVPLAPERMRRMGLEWAYRLYKEPWRWRRQLALPRFAAGVLWQALRERTRKN